jgi:transposase-like protein
MLSAKRDVKAVKAFVRKAIKHQGQPPKTVTLDGYAASYCAVREMKADGMLPGDTKTLAGIELMHRIRKGQFSLAGLRLKDATASDVWSAVFSV